VRREVSDIFKEIHSHAGRALPPGRFLVINSVIKRVHSRPTLRLEGLGQLTKSDLTGNRTRDVPARISRDVCGRTENESLNLVTLH
jgi:hypothetical protein